MRVVIYTRVSTEDQAERVFFWKFSESFLKNLQREKNRAFIIPRKIKYMKMMATVAI